MCMFLKDSTTHFLVEDKQSNGEEEITCRLNLVIIINFVSMFAQQLK